MPGWPRWRGLPLSARWRSLRRRLRLNRSRGLRRPGCTRRAWRPTPGRCLRTTTRATVTDRGCEGVCGSVCRRWRSGLSASRCGVSRASGPVVVGVDGFGSVRAVGSWRCSLRGRGERAVEAAPDFAGVQELPEKLGKDGVTIVVGDPEASTRVRLYEDPRCPVCEEFETAGGSPESRSPVARRGRGRLTDSLPRCGCRPRPGPARPQVCAGAARSRSVAATVRRVPHAGAAFLRRPADQPVLALPVGHSPEGRGSTKCRTSPA
ncbi:thioredoxin domain-containing protein [Streptomyces sp. AC512_CC834]|uniref:thioredoxin domain-containing protein n=1 Tax=Streptomyces sp. AC512_CC834 TaxID=2823691 RepID=UPI0027E46BCC|nr:thioredoxin domain-containing protein [Streptomyces sp. AC512_CC834]